MARLLADPLLILGAPRSGTTYLRELIDAHHAAHITNEVRLFTWLHRALQQDTGDDLALFEQREAFCDHLRRELPAVVRGFYAQQAPRARLWGDKNPHYAQDPGIARSVVQVFPGTRFIHIHRDPRAVVASLLRKRHADGRPWVGLERAHELVLGHVRNALDLEREPFGARVHRVAHADLVSDDEASAGRLFDWLSEPIDAAVLALCRAQRTVRTPFSGPTTDLAQTGSRAATLAAWREAVPPDRQRESLAYLASILLELGYESRTSLDALHDEL